MPPPTNFSNGEMIKLSWLLVVNGQYAMNTMHATMQRNCMILCLNDLMTVFSIVKYAECPLFFILFKLFNANMAVDAFDIVIGRVL